MKKLFLLLVFLLLFLTGRNPVYSQSSINLASRVQALAPTYIYVSNSGSASNDGSMPLLAITPAKLLTLSLRPGQTVNFNRGESFSSFEFSSVPSGVKFDAYGTGAYPILYGSTSLSGATWTSIGGNVYTTPVSSAALWMYQNEVEAPLAESPWYAITSQSSSTVITATSLIGAWGSTIVGAKIVIKEYYFAYSHVMTVTAFNSGTGQITLSDPIQTGRTGYSFKLFDQQQFLSAGEWWYNSSDGKIYYQTASGSPSSSTWRYTTKNTAFTLTTGATDVSIQHLDMRQYYNAAIRGKDNPRTTIRNNAISRIRQNGIFLYGVNANTDISYNTITYCAQNGMYLGGLTDHTINYNTVRLIGLQASIPFIQKLGSSVFSWEQTTGSAIVYTRDSTTTNINSLRSTVSHNTMDSLSYMGFSGLGSYNTVTYNEVSNYLLKFYDGGGIYFIKAFGFDPTCSYNTISKNIIHNAIGTQEYTPGLFNKNVYGIYLDSNCDHFTVDNNVIYELDGAGLNSNYGGHHNTYTNNIVAGVLIGILFHNNVGGSIVANVSNVLTENVFGMRTSSQICVLAEDYNGSTTYNPFSSGGETNRNYYLNPYSTTLFSYSSTVNGTRTGQTLAQWQSHMSGDADSKNTTIAYSYSSAANALLEVKLLVNRTDYPNRAFAATNYQSIDAVSAYNLQVPAFGGLLLLKSVSGGTVLVSDLFTGTNGTSISAHSPNVGGTWTIQSGACTLNGSGFLGGGATAADVTQNTIASDITIELIGKTTTSGGGIDIIARHNNVNTSFANESFIWVAWYSGVIGLYTKPTGTGSATTLTTAAATLAQNTEYTVTLELIGTHAVVKINNATVIDYTAPGTELDLNLTSTKHGFRIGTSTAASLYNSITISN